MTRQEAKKLKVVPRVAAEAPRDKFDRFVTELETQLQKRLDAVPAGSAQCEALFDVYMAVRLAAKEAASL